MTTRRTFLSALPTTGAAFALGGALLDEGPAMAQGAPDALAGHFHLRGKAPSEHTRRVIAEAVQGLPFTDTPNTEAPREMNTYLPDLKALWMAENVTATIHNIYTLRGAPVRAQEGAGLVPPRGGVWQRPCLTDDTITIGTTAITTQTAGGEANIRFGAADKSATEAVCMPAHQRGRCEICSQVESQVRQVYNGTIARFGTDVSFADPDERALRC